MIRSLLFASVTNTIRVVPLCITLLSASALHAAEPSLHINDTTLSQADIQQQWNALFPDGSAPAMEVMDPAMRERMLLGIASEHILYKKAESSDIASDPAVKRSMEAAARRVLLDAFIRKQAQARITDTQINAAYKKHLKENKQEKEVKARHILVADEAEAKKIYDRIQAGEDFSALAKEFSVDKASGSNGGDLGYFTKERMVKPFADAAFTLKKGDISTPVQTDFGWHIIKVEDSRLQTLPTLKELEPSLREKLAQDAAREYMETLMQGVNIRYTDEAGKTHVLHLGK